VTCRRPSSLDLGFDLGGFFCGRRSEAKSLEPPCARPFIPESRVRGGAERGTVAGRFQRPRHSISGIPRRAARARLGTVTERERVRAEISRRADAFRALALSSVGYFFRRNAPIGAVRRVFGRTVRSGGRSGGGVGRRFVTELRGNVTLKCLDGTEIERVETMKYLSVMIDDRLTQ